MYRSMPSGCLLDALHRQSPIANRQFKTEPRMLVGAKGMYYTTDDGREIIDGTSGLWCCNAGHGHAEIADAVHRQLSEMDYTPSFQMGHPIAFEYADRLKALAPNGFGHIFSPVQAQKQSILR